ncbi:MAG: fumarylacetoacetate hydrolase family protein [Parahaliea sp.]
MNRITVSGQAITPGKIVCIGRNYVAHIEELGNEVPDNMVVFLKPNSAIGQELSASFGGDIHYEGELCFIVDNERLTAVGFGLDLTLRDLQNQLKAKGLPWERAKAFNGAALFSDFVPLPEAGIASLSLELHVNGKLRQQGKPSLMIYSPQVIAEQISQFMQLEDGDILMTGTPAGVGPVQRGDTFHGRILSHQQVLTEATWRVK